jgi:alkyl hydroperoxide reductase subunit AhpF
VQILRDRDRELLRERLESGLVDPVRLILFTEPQTALYVPGRRNCVSCADTEALMREVAELTDKIQLEIHNVREDPQLAETWNVTFTPAIAVCRESDAGVRFLGLPAGFEFLSFLETVISASSGDGFGLRPETLEKLKELEEGLEIKIFSTPT